MAEPEKKKYEINEMKKKIKRNIFIGKLIAGNNIFSHFLHFLYLLNRKRRLKLVRS